MKAIVVREPGGPEALEYAEVPDPEVGPDEVLVDVTATAVNRADLLQRQGHYDPPPGASDVIGLECSGTVAAVGASVTGHRVGDRGVRPAVGRRLRDPRRRARRSGDAGARRGRPGDRGRAARGRGDRVVQRDDGGRAAARATSSWSTAAPAGSAPSPSSSAPPSAPGS